LERNRSIYEAVKNNTRSVENTTEKIYMKEKMMKKEK